MPRRSLSSVPVMTRPHPLQLALAHPPCHCPCRRFQLPCQPQVLVIKPRESSQDFKVLQDHPLSTHTNIITTTIAIITNTAVSLGICNLERPLYRPHIPILRRRPRSQILLGQS